MGANQAVRKHINVLRLNFIFSKTLSSSALILVMPLTMSSDVNTCAPSFIFCIESHID